MYKWISDTQKKFIPLFNPSWGSQRMGHHQTAAAVEAVHQGSVVVLADLPTAACSEPAGDTEAAARQNILMSW